MTFCGNCIRCMSSCCGRTLKTRPNRLSTASIRLVSSSTACTVIRQRTCRASTRKLIIDCSASAFSLQPKHGIAVKPYRVEQDPLKEDTTLKNLVPFLQFVALNQRLKGSTTPFHKELEALGVSTTIDDGGVDFQKAVDARFAELRAAGKMPMQRGRSSFMGGGGDSSGAAAAGGSVWERMGLRKGAQ